MTCSSLAFKIGDILVEHANSDQVKIGDFGLSHRLIPGKPVFLRYGHPEFIAPEIVASKEACLASDMWSIGVITYLLLTGESPFLSNNDRETLEKVKKGEIDFNYLDTFASISNEGKDFLKKLLNLNVNQRMDIKKAINHPWLAADKRNSRTSQLNNIDKLREYRNKWTSWVSTMDNINCWINCECFFSSSPNLLYSTKMRLAKNGIDVIQ